MAHLAIDIAAGSDRPRLWVRPWRTTDMPDLLVAMALDQPADGFEAHPDIAVPGPLRWTGPLDDEEAVLWLSRQERGWSDGHRLTFAVVDALRRRAVGHVGLWDRDRNVVGSGGRGEIGYWTAADARGHGIAPAAVRAVTDWAFSSYGIERLPCIMLVHDVNNHASCRVAAKSGYPFLELSPANPPLWSTEGHIHLAEPTVR